MQPVLDLPVTTNPLSQLDRVRTIATQTRDVISHFHCRLALTPTLPLDTHHLSQLRPGPMILVEPCTGRHRPLLHTTVTVVGARHALQVLTPPSPLVGGKKRSHLPRTPLRCRP